MAMLVTIDFETFYDSNYSLRKISEVDYILSPMYQTIMCAIKIDHAPTNVYIGDTHIRDAFGAIPWERACVLSHNMRFDGAILAWRFGIVPAFYLDTLSMARALTHPTIGSSSLDSVSKYLGLPPKGDEVVRAMGKRLEDFQPNELSAYADYCVRDTENCRMIFDAFVHVGFPSSELRVIDIIQRMFILPQAKLDQHKLAANVQRARAEREHAFNQVAHIDRSVFSSQQKFALLLDSMGIMVPTKPSPTHLDQRIPALAKNDPAFQSMLEDETLPLEVQACLLARVGAKSTIEETRSVTLFNLSQRVWGDNVTGWMPVPLKYYGAHTGRPSGDGGFNFTNFRRGSPIRDAITCDPDERIIHRDSSQIEARMVAWLADCENLLEAFRQGRDIYSEFASRFYGRKITKANVVERFVGKGCILGLGYGMGGPRLKRQLRIGSGGISVDLTEDEAEVLKRFYRESYPEIPELWLRGEMVLSRIMVDPDDRLNPTFQRLGRASINFDMPIKAITEGSEAIWLPNGLCINYPRLRYLWAPNEGTSILYDGPRKQPKYLFGGKVVENICQALARIVITDVMVRTFQETGYHPILTTYDSLDYLVPAGEAQAMDAYLAHAFARTPTWAAGLPLASEGGWGRTLAEAEKGVNA